MLLANGSLITDLTILILILLNLHYGYLGLSGGKIIGCNAIILIYVHLIGVNLMMGSILHGSIWLILIWGIVLGNCRG